MTFAVLYRWKLKPGRAQDFKRAWAEGTRLLHETCGSQGACLHENEDGKVWSYARWPSDGVRGACFEEHDWFSHACFKVMQDCVQERYDEVGLTVIEDQLDTKVKTKPVPALTTDRLILRPMVIEDAAHLLPALSDDDTMRYWSSGPMKSLEEVRKYLHWNIKGVGVDCFVIARKQAPEKALGWVVLMDRKQNTAEVGYFLSPDAQGQGFAREAAQKVIEHGFQARKFRRIYADVDPDNAGSIRLLEVLGFEFEGRMRESWETHIGVRDSCIYSLLATS